MTIETQLLVVDPQRPDTAVLTRAAAVIQAGGLVAFPTETVYGLGADGLNETAVRRIFQAKGRPAHDPIIVHVAETADLPRVAANVPQMAYELAARFWPGPLTLVLPRGTAVPDAITAGGPTVAVRCPQHPLAQALIRAAGTPIGAPSANRFSHTSPTTAQHVWDDLAGRIELILDGGPTPIGVESTVLDVTGAAPLLLRPGGVTVEELTAVLGPIHVFERQGKAPAAMPAPGMLDRHYAPQAELRLFTGPETAVRAAMRRTIALERENGRGVALLLAAEDVPYFMDLDAPIGNVGSLQNLSQVAQNLFRVMRELDVPATDLILARDFPAAGLGLAIRDRLRRAAQRFISTG